jgi:hypothetical protein
VINIWLWQLSGSQGQFFNGSNDAHLFRAAMGSAEDRQVSAQQPGLPNMLKQTGSI